MTMVALRFFSICLMRSIEAMVVVEARHAVAVIVLVEMRRIADQHHRSLLPESHEQRLVSRRVTGRTQHHDAAVEMIAAHSRAAC